MSQDAVARETQNLIAATVASGAYADRTVKRVVTLLMIWLDERGYALTGQGVMKIRSMPDAPPDPVVSPATR